MRIKNLDGEWEAINSSGHRSTLGLHHLRFPSVSLPTRVPIPVRRIGALAVLPLLLAARGARAQEASAHGAPDSAAVAEADTSALPPLLLPLPQRAPADIRIRRTRQVRASLLDASVSAGVAASTPWLEEGGRDRGPGIGPAVGVDARYWISPTLGVRLGATYFSGTMDNERSVEDSGMFRSLEETVRVHGLAYDAGVVFRPFLWTSGHPAVSSAYLFAGAGGLTVLVRGDTAALSPEDDPDCVTLYQEDRLCLPERKTVPQATAGVGADLFRLSGDLSLYAEAAVSLYEPPVRERGFPPALPDRAPGLGPRLTLPPPISGPSGGSGLAATGRLVLGVRKSFGNILPPPVNPPPPFPPPPTQYQGPGRVHVTSTPRGAEVYVVRAMIATPALLCGLTSSDPTYFQGYTHGEPVVVSRDEQPHIVVVRLGNREFREPFPMIRDTIRTRHYDFAQAPPRSCPP